MQQHTLRVSTISPSEAIQKTSTVLFCSLRDIWEGAATLWPVDYISYDVILWAATAPPYAHTLEKPATQTHIHTYTDLCDRQHGSQRKHISNVVVNNEMNEWKDQRHIIHQLHTKWNLVRETDFSLIKNYSLISFVEIIQVGNRWLHHSRLNVSECLSPSSSLSIFTPPGSGSFLASLFSAARPHFWVVPTKCFFHVIFIPSPSLKKPAINSLSLPRPPVCSFSTNLAPSEG